MVVEELIDGGERVLHYSDLHFKIRQIETNILYDDAADYMPCIYTYEETNIPIEEIEE